jgi:hypothetical protein
MSRLEAGQYLRSVGIAMLLGIAHYEAMKADYCFTVIEIPVFSRPIRNNGLIGFLLDTAHLYSNPLSLLESVFIPSQ